MNKFPEISAKGKNHESMQLNKLQLNNMDLKKCKSVPVVKQATVNIFHREYNNFKSVTANQQEQQVFKLVRDLESSAVQMIQRQ